MTEGEFLKLSPRQRHKLAARFVRAFYERRESQDLSLYRRIERWCGLLPLEESLFAPLSDRYHLHLTQAGLSWKEHNLLSSPLHQRDTPSEVPYLPLCVYLDHLRSAFNVGSILRTTEAFRLGTLYFSQETPFIDNPKVQKTSMCSYSLVPCEQILDPTLLPRPWIALETAPLATSVLDYPFPPAFTLLLGNEEYGISETLLKSSDALVTIPLHGFKRSLNVAAAYAISAAAISHKLRY